MIKDKLIKYKPNNKTKRFFTDYIKDNNGEVIIKQSLLKELFPSNPCLKVECFCDDCGKEEIKLVRDVELTHTYCKACKTKRTNIKRYGVPFLAQNKEIKEKQKQSYAKHDMKEVIKKRKQKCLELYGYDNPMKVPEIHKKAEETNIKKYGCKNVFQNKEIQAKQKETVKEIYGCENVFQNEQVKEKCKQTMNEKYGVDYAQQNKEIHKKTLDTLIKINGIPTSKQQIEICNMLQGQLNVRIDNYVIDILLPNHIIVEYNGGGHELSVKLGELTLEQFQQKEIRRNNFLINLGYKLLIIESKKDKLPSNLLEMINNAITKFSDTQKILYLNIDL